MTTRAFSFRRWRARWEPRKPAPPEIKIVGEKEDFSTTGGAAIAVLHTSVSEYQAVLHTSVSEYQAVLHTSVSEYQAVLRTSLTCSSEL